jgi:PAS domain S-box-containing protein
MLEDVAADAALIERELRKAKLAIWAKRVETREDFVRELQEFGPDLILSDYSLPAFDGLTAMGLARELVPATPFIFVTGSLDEETDRRVPKKRLRGLRDQGTSGPPGAAVEAALERKGAREAQGRTEEKLHRSQETFRRIVQTASEGIWVVDVEGGTSYVNRRMADMLGFTVVEMLGRPMLDFLGDKGREALASQLRECRQGSTKQYDIKLRRKDGAALWAIVSAGPMSDSQGQFTGSLQMVTDITDRKRAEEELAEKVQELARYNAELEQFAHVAAHDLQEPLRTVVSFTQLLAQRYRGHLDADADKFIDLIVGGAHRIRQLIDGLLSYSRVTRREAACKLTDCEAVFQQSLDSLAQSVEESRVTLTHDPLPTLLADPARLQQLFENLIGNALKFRGPDPVRLHGKEQYPGIGIGLAICKRIVESLHGRIWVESEPGNGAAFNFTLPV